MGLANLLVGAALAVAGVAQDGPDPRLRSAGGASVIFAPASDRLEAAAEARLRAFARASRAFRSVAILHIDSAGDGQGDAFDRSLAWRCSDAIRRLLTGQGYRQFMIRVRAPGPNARTSDVDGDLLRIGHVSQILSNENYARFLPGRNLECF